MKTPTAAEMTKAVAIAMHAQTLADFHEAEKSVLEDFPEMATTGFDYVTHLCTSFGLTEELQQSLAQQFPVFASLDVNLQRITLLVLYGKFAGTEETIASKIRLEDVVN